MGGRLIRFDNDHQLYNRIVKDISLLPSDRDLWRDPHCLRTVIWNDHIGSFPFIAFDMWVLHLSASFDARACFAIANSLLA